MFMPLTQHYFFFHYPCGITVHKQRYRHSDRINIHCTNIKDSQFSSTNIFSFFVFGTGQPNKIFCVELHPVNINVIHMSCNACLKPLSRWHLNNFFFFFWCSWVACLTIVMYTLSQNLPSCIFSQDIIYIVICMTGISHTFSWFISHVKTVNLFSNYCMEI